MTPVPEAAPGGSLHRQLLAMRQLLRVTKIKTIQMRRLRDKLRG
jgi:hypothetical protein